MFPVQASSILATFEVKINDDLIRYDNKLAKEAKNYPGSNLRCG